jgi:hypothetical protein
LWNASDKQWYTLFTWIEPDGQYGADFSGIVEMTPADRIRLWVRDEDGNQQASIGATLDYGVSTSHDKVWGYTAAESIVELNLYKGHDGDGNLLDLIGSAAVRADPSGYYTATLTADGFPVDIAPTNVLQVIAAEHIKTLFIGQLSAEGDMDNDSLTIYGPPDAVVQLVGYRSIVATAQTAIPSSYLQLETTIGSNGEVTIDLVQYDLQDGDIFDVTAYIVEQGAVIHRTMMAPSFEDVFLPLVIK